MAKVVKRTFSLTEGQAKFIDKKVGAGDMPRAARSFQPACGRCNLRTPLSKDSFAMECFRRSMRWKSTLRG